MFADFVEVIDGDTVKVRLSAGDGTESLRLIALDTEEKRQISADKPKTRAGELATQFAEVFFAGADAVEVEFDTDDPLEECLVRHRGNYGRLICSSGATARTTILRPSAAATAPISSSMAVRASITGSLPRPRPRRWPPAR